MHELFGRGSVAASLSQTSGTMSRKVAFGLAIAATLAAWGVLSSSLRATPPTGPGFDTTPAFAGMEGKMWQAERAPKNGLGLPPYDPNVVLVAFHANVSNGQRANIAALNGLEVDETCKSPYFYRLQITPAAKASGVTVESALKSLLTNPAVRIAERDWIVSIQQNIPNDAKFSQLWGMRNTGQTGGTPGADIDATLAWQTITGSNTVKVAVIDTGTDYTHPDLAANAWINPGEIPGNLVDDDGNGYVDDVRGYDFVNNDGDPMDDNAHGTHCFGTIGGVGNNGIGVAGVCWNVKVIGVKFLSAGGSGSTSNAILSVDYARIAGANIMSNSWGGGGFSQLLLDAILRARTAGIMFVAAAGNNGSNNDGGSFYPANYNSQADNVVSVAATTHNDVKAGFSNYGANSVDIAAPGESIVSTVPPGLDSDGTPDGYESYSGTSMACPHISGAAALTLARFPGSTYLQIKSRLMNTAERIPALSGLTKSGRLNVFNAFDNDSVAPGTPTGLVGIKRSASTIRVRWTASGDDGAVGSASSYELRYSKSPINAGNFASATLVTTVPAPAVSGSQQDAAISGLFPGDSYYVALRALDNVGNMSGIVTAGPYTTMAAVFTDRMEGAPGFTAQGGSTWALTTSQSLSPTKSWTDSPAGNYLDNSDTWLEMTNPINVTQAMALGFFCKYTLETGYDYLYVEISNNNGASWTRALTLNGSSEWKGYSVSLAGYVGQTVRVRFRLTTDSSVVYDGVYIDDVTLIPQVRFAIDNVEGAPQYVGDAPWAITNAKSASPTRSWTDSPAGDYVDNVSINLTQTGNTAIPAYENVQVVFNAELNLETGYDYLEVWVSGDNGATYTQGGRWTGTRAWSAYSAPTTGASQAKIRFKMTSDYSIVLDGVYVDDIALVGEPCEAITTTLPVSGTVTLQNLLPSPNGQAVVFELRNVGSGTALETINGSLNGSGGYTINIASGAGTYDLYAKGSHWLRRRVGSVVITGSGAVGVNFSLVNGDIDGNNLIDSDDFDILVANFGGTGQGDLDENGTVDSDDFDILVAAFGQFGDN
ncbi:MAG TPA: S8 family serine peptidase [Fimbriimonadaceae bacterium]|nr:S8 family serine peptidase [Fimbriimonadaceae bacterium]